MRIAIVASRFNQNITENLVKGVQQLLKSKGLEEAEVYWVPGAYELPLTCKWLSKKYDALVAVGTVIKGETLHFDFISSVASKGIAEVSRKVGIPIGFGVITANNVEQAIARSANDENNLGHRAARATLEMLSIKKEIEGS